MRHMGERQLNSETTKRRYQQVLEAIDRIAERDQLAFLTTQRISRESGVSDGVLFRHFSSKEAILSAWVDSRAEQLRLMMEAMPAGRSGLMYLLQNVLEQSALLSFLCCQPMDTPYLRQQMDVARNQFRMVVQTRIELLSSTPVGIAPDALADHLMQSIYRAWNPASEDRQAQKERLMNQLPWEKNESCDQIFPSMDILQRLALSESGFVFDPVNGRSFTANDVGLYILHCLQQSNDMEELLASVERDFNISRADAQRDLTEFAAQLRKFLA